MAFCVISRIRGQKFTAAISGISKANPSRAPVPPAKSIRPPCAPAPSRPARTPRSESRPPTTPPRRRRNQRPAASSGRHIAKTAGRAAVWDLFPAAKPARASRWKSSRINFLARRKAAISRCTPASVSPGNVRRSTAILQRSGTMFGCAPPEIVPTFTVAVPSSGCFRLRNCAA